MSKSTRYFSLVLVLTFAMFLCSCGNQKKIDSNVITSGIDKETDDKGSKTVSQTATKKEQPIKYKKIVYKDYTVVKKLSEHSITNCYSGTDRNTNLDVACKLINGEKGLILDPGDEFDWFKVVGQTTAEKGFKEAGVIVDKHHAEALGGGVCQVASTLNSAVIEAGIETKCYRHSVKVGYLSDKDYEATVSYDAGKNITFTNTLDFPIRINIKADGNTVTAKVYQLDVQEYWIFHEIK